MLYTHRIFVEKIQHHFGQTIVAPMSVHQKKRFQILEPRECEIGRHDGLHSLLTGYSYTNVGGLNHRNVVGAVAYGQRPHFQFFFHHFHDESFLKGRRTAT